MRSGTRRIITARLPATATVTATPPRPTVITVAAPRTRVTQDRSLPAPREIVLPARQRPGMQALGRVRIWSPPPRRVTP